jgi:DNA ligase (NAD+)
VNKTNPTARLEQRIQAYQYAYYNGLPRNPDISDAEFDALYDELKRKNPKSPVLAAVGADPIKGFPKAPHIIPMGSQEKAANPTQFLYWAAKTRPSSYIVQYKLDGASLELQYQQGILTRALTRGNGVTGNDITPNARLMMGVLPKLPAPFTGGIRGEVIMTRKVWAEKYAGKRSRRRDTANGIMFHRDGSGCENLSFIAYDAAAVGNDRFFTAETLKITWLGTMGFQTVGIREFRRPQDVITYKTDVEKRWAALPVDIDGLVIKDSRTDMSDLRRPRPKRQVAFKFSTAAEILGA